MPLLPISHFFPERSGQESLRNRNALRRDRSQVVRQFRLCQCAYSECALHVDGIETICVWFPTRTADDFAGPYVDFFCLSLEYCHSAWSRVRTLTPFLRASARQISTYADQKAKSYRGGLA